MSTAKHFICKSLVSGITMSGASIITVGRRALFSGTLFNKYYEIPIWAICGAVGAASSLVADGLHLLMEENIPLNQKVDHELAMATGIGVSTAAFALTLYGLNPASIHEMGLLKICAMGAVSEVASSYLCNFIFPNEDYYL